MDGGTFRDEKTVISGTFKASTDGKSSFAFPATSQEVFDLLSKDPEGKTNYE